MTRSIAVFFAAISISLVTSDALRAADLMPPHIAEQLGLTESWKRYVQVPAGAQSIADQKIYVHSENPIEYVEISVPATPASPPAEGEAAAKMKVLVRIPTDKVGIHDKDLAKKEAERLANNQIRRLKRRGIEATLSSRKVARVHLYTLGDDGTLECRDAETGEPVWMCRVGQRGLNYGALGVNDQFVTVINGANLIQVDVTNGEEIQEVRMMGTPIHGAVHAGRFALIPTIRSGVEGYPLYDPTLDPFMEIVEGVALALPAKAPDSTRVAWGTDRGFVYVMELAGTPSVLFRLNTDGIVSGRIASATGNRFFFGSESGQVYGIRATRTGKVIWSKPFGEPFYHEPIVVGKQLLLRSTYGNLFSLDTENGLGTWEDTAPNIADLLGAIDGKIYTRTLSGSMAVLDLETGKRIGSYNEVQPGRMLVNRQTDRLYLVGESGAVQCLRPTAAELPNFTEQPDTQEEPEEEAAATKPAGGLPFDPAAAKDPFGAGGDPFGAGDPAADPFGGADDMADPFGGGAGDDMADPFGDDPFGN